MASSKRATERASVASEEITVGFDPAIGEDGSVSVPLVNGRPFVPRMVEEPKIRWLAPRSMGVIPWGHAFTKDGKISLCGFVKIDQAFYPEGETKDVRKCPTCAEAEGRMGRDHGR